MINKSFLIASLSVVLTFSSQTMEPPKAFETYGEILDTLGDRMYCIAECNGNKDNDIEKELDLCHQRITELCKTQPLNPQQHTKAFLGACGLANRKILKLFLAAQFDLEARNDGKQTPLMIAAFSGNCETVQALIEAGADVRAKDKHGKTARHYATFVPSQFEKPENPFAPIALIPKLVVATARSKNQDPFKQCKKLIKAQEAALAAQAIKALDYLDLARKPQ